MNRAALLPVFVLCTAGGAFLHHLTGAGVTGTRRSAHRSVPDTRSAGDSAAAFFRSGAAGMADALLAAAPWKGETNWVLLEERLNAMQPGEYLLVIRELQGRNDRFLYEGGTLRTALVERAAAVDAKGLLAFAEEAFAAGRLEVVAGECFRHDPDAVLAAILRLEGTEENVEQAQSRTNGLLVNALSATGTGDPVAMLASLERAGFLDRNRIPNREGARVASEDYLSRLPGSFGRSGGLGSLGGLPARNFANGSEVFSLYAGAMTSWARQDIQAALAFALKHPSLLPEAVFAWAGSDVDAALAWVRQSAERESLVFANTGYGEEGPKPPDGKLAMRRLYLEYAKEHPLEVERLSDEIPPRLLLVAQAEGMKSAPVEAIVAWVQKLPENLRGSVASDILPELLETDVERAYAFYKQFPESANSSTRLEMVDFQARRDPAEAAAFLQSSGLSGDARDQALWAIVAAWRDVDPTAAQRYVESLPPSEVQGRLLMENSQILRDETREAALAWAMKLPQLSQRIGAVQSIIGDEPFGDPDIIDRVPDAAVREALRKPVPEPSTRLEEEALDVGAGDPFAASPADPFQRK